MQFVPIPCVHADLVKAMPHWLPFVKALAKHNREDLKDVLHRIETFEVQIALIWDEDKQQARALLGIRFAKRARDVVAEVIWCTGTGRRHWQHLIERVEQYCADQGCATVRLLCRPGWSRVLKDSGYKTTHYTMEKDIWALQVPHP
jgi:hypothetical protein